MRMLFILCFMLIGVAHARPPTGTSSDSMSDFLSEHGLADRIGEVTQQVENTASDLVLHAMAFLGAPYKRGGSSVETGFDCSGFVRAVYAQTLGKMLPRRAEQQAAATQVIEPAELQPGDLVFFNTLRRAFSHVGIYVGDGKFIHSPRPGAQVRVDELDRSYWHRRFDGARRVFVEQSNADSSY